MKQLIRDFKETWVKPTKLYKRYRVWKNKPFTANGAWGEDILLKRIFLKNQKHRNGTFVDVGCNHPIVGNVTYGLYEAGWRGLNLDLTQWNIDLCDMLRPGDRNVRCGVSSAVGEMTAYIFDPTSGVNTLDRDHALEWQPHINKPIAEESIQVRTLTDLVVEFLPGRQIDLINIDVEGHDLEVLRGFDLARFRPCVVLVEIHIRRLEDLLESGVYQHMIAHGYVCIAHYRASCFFARKDFDCGV